MTTGVHLCIHVSDSYEEKAQLASLSAAPGQRHMTCGPSVATQEKSTARRFRGASRSTVLCDSLPRGKTSKPNALANMALSQKTTKLYPVPLVSWGYHWGRSPVVCFCSVQQGCPGGSTGRGQGHTHSTLADPFSAGETAPSPCTATGSEACFLPAVRLWYPLQDNVPIKLLLLGHGLGPHPGISQPAPLTLALCAHLD